MCYRISDVCSIQIYSPGNPLVRRCSVASAHLLIMVNTIPKILMMVYRLYSETKKNVKIRGCGLIMNGKGVLELNRIGIGRTAEVFEIDNEKILKLFYDGISPETVTCEYAISEALSRRIQNMPKVYELVTEGNRRGIVFQRIQGSHMARVMLKNPAAIPDLVRKFSLLHKSILSVDLQGETLEFDDITGIIERCRESHQLTEQEEDIVERFLTASDTRQLCHGDFHPENVLIDSDGMLWIIDWITVVLCNGMFDIARTYYLLRYAQSPEKKPTLVRIVERMACTYISRAYYKNMIGSREDKKMLTCFFFIMLLMRTGEGIPEEQGTLARLIRTKKKSALKEMQRYLKG